MKTLAYLLQLITLLLGTSLTCLGQIPFRQSTDIALTVNKISIDSLHNTIDKLVSFHTRHNLSSKSKSDFGIGAAANYIESRLHSIKKSHHKMSVERMTYKAGGKGSRLLREVELSNIIATIKGESSRTIVLLAHYDSRTDDNNDSLSFAPGADDNGSGVAALLEIARLLPKERLKCNVIIAFLSGEEHGLIGAEMLSRRAVEEKWNIVAVLNNDMIGNSTASETGEKNNSVVRVFSDNNEEIRQLARYIKETSERYVENLSVKLIYRNDRFGRGGDHTPFVKKGFNAVRVCEYYENYDRTHRPAEKGPLSNRGDVISGVDFEYLKKSCALNLATVYNLALAPLPPKNVVMHTSGLSNYTTITWDNPDSTSKNNMYNILIRDTDKSMWDKKIIVKGNSVKLPYSKDNFIFSCQSVDENGHESIPVEAVGKN